MCSVLTVARVFVPITIRLVYLKPTRVVGDTTFRYVVPAVLLQISMHLSLITASLPCLKPFIAPFKASRERSQLSGTSLPSTRPLSGASSDQARSVALVPGFMFRRQSIVPQQSHSGSSVSYYSTEKDYRLSRVITRPPCRDATVRPSQEVARLQEQEEWIAALANPGVGRPFKMRSDSLGFEVTVDSGSPSTEFPPALKRAGHGLSAIHDDEEEEENMYIRQVKEIVVEYSYLDREDVI